jgi:integrase
MPHITDQFVRKLQPPARGNRVHYDDDVSGFGIRITSGSHKAFVLNFRINSRERRMTIGAYPAWSVTAAREQAKEIRREIDLGRDPLKKRIEGRTAPTMPELWLRYEKEHLPRIAKRSQSDQRSMFLKLILPKLGALKVSEVRHEDIDELHQEISQHHPVRANRVVEVLRKAFNLAIRWGWRTDNPGKGVHRNPEQKRTRYLSAAELSRLYEALAKHPEKSSVDAIRLLALTGARRGEVLAARWDEFDLRAGIWTKPSANTKQRREHRVPLSGPAISLLQELRRRTNGDYVFPGKHGKPLADVKRTWRTVVEQAALSDVRLHDLRHTYASILVSGGASLPVVGALLGHTQPATTARYAHLYDDPLRAATERVAETVTAGANREAAAAEAEIVQLPKRA